MTTSQAKPSVSRRTALAGLGASGLGIALATARPAAAQDAATDMATHPIVGAWHVAGDPSDPDDVQFIAFHGDGTVSGVHAIAGAGIGIWRPTGERTGEMTGRAVNNSFDAGQYRRGINSGWTSFEVAADGKTYTGSLTVVLTETDGTYFAGFSATTSATRLEFEPVPSPDGPAATPAT